MATRKSIHSTAYTEGNHAVLIRGGREFFSTLQELIDGAISTLHLQTYIFNDDETGRQIANSLKKAVERKVSVFVVVDGFASQKLPKSFVQELRMAGIQFRFFAPIFKSASFYFGRRMHHKVAVADACRALVGGINIADRYNDLPGQAAWLDFALLVEGKIAVDLCELCKEIWQSNFPGRKIGNCVTALGRNTDTPPNKLDIRIRRNDWLRRRNEVSATYIEMLRTANSDLTILCSYFLPGKVIRRQLVHAIRRGVKIRVVAAGRSDVMLAKYAERWLYDWLLRNGIELFEYQKNILHGKMAVCDGQWMTIGSYNINNISAYASIELNLDVKNEPFSKQQKEMLDLIISNDCLNIIAEQELKSKNIFSRFIQWFSYQFIRVVFYLFTFNFKRSH